MGAGDEVGRFDRPEHLLSCQTPWIAPAIETVLLGMTITTVNNICVTYAIDSYLEVSGEVVTIVFVIRKTI